MFLVFTNVDTQSVVSCRFIDAYYKIAVKSLSGSSASDPRRSQRKGAADNSEEVSPIDDCRDVWLAEMRYRVAVAFVSAFWEKASAELSRLFTLLKETECQRRFRLRELLISMLQRKERLFLGLPSVLTPVLQDLINRPMDSATIEDDVQTSIRIRAQSMKKAELEAKKAKEPGPGLTGVNAENGKFELTSPLTSELLCKASVVERKVAGVMSGWKTALAVVTADSFLHLFECPSSHKVRCGSAPEVAFHALMPPIEVPTQDTIKGNTQKTTKGWGDIAPSMSIVLPNSYISYADHNKNSVFEITEMYFTHGASKVFGKTSVRKVQLRTFTRDETIDWIAILKAQK